MGGRLLSLRNNNNNDFKLSGWKESQEVHGEIFDVFYLLRYGMSRMYDVWDTSKSYER